MAFKTITIRLPVETLMEVERIAEKQKINRSELIRSLLDSALKEQRLEEAVEAYRNRRVTLWKASEMGGVTLREMMDIVAERKIPVSYSVDDVERAFEYAKQRIEFVMR